MGIVTKAESLVAAELCTTILLPWQTNGTPADTGKAPPVALKVNK